MTSFQTCYTDKNSKCIKINQAGATSKQEKIGAGEMAQLIMAMDANLKIMCSIHKIYVILRDN